MKRFILLFVVLASCYSSFGQVTATEIRKKIWNKADQDFTKTEIPEEWKDESAVIICQEISADYDKFGLSGLNKTKLRFKEIFHKRIKLLDQAAVERYSEFSFADELGYGRGKYTKRSTLYYGLKVVKADGRENIVDLTEAVDVEGDGNKNIKKIPVPNLEEGDILDYYFYTEEEFVTDKSYAFYPSISDLNARYSIMKQKYKFVVEKNFYINFRSVNGAPELQVKEDIENKKIIYSLVDEHRSKQSYPIWIYPYREYPTIKFQVIYARKNVKDDLFAFLGESGVAKNNVSKDEVLEFVKEHFNDIGFEAKTAIKETQAYLKSEGLKKANAEKKLEKAYYYLRHKLYTQKVEMSMRTGGRVGVSEMKFAQIISSLLKKWDVPHELLVVADKNYTNLENLLFYRELSLVIKVNFKLPVYISNTYMHSRYNELPGILENAEAYVIDVTNSNLSIKTTVTPSSSHKKNNLYTETEISFEEDDLSTLYFKRTQKMIGLSKRSTQNDVVEFLDFVVDDSYTYGTKSIFQPGYFYYQADINKMNEMVKEGKEKIEKRRKEALEADAASDFGVELASFDSYEIVSRGRDINQPEFVLKDEFSINNFVKKAGPNYLLEAGKLIGGQVEIDEEDKTRTTDVYMPYARSYKYSVIINIPEGYTVKGIDKLNTSIENETGGFITSATFENGQLKITSHKFYKKNIEKKENWQLMQEFLNAALNFKEQKVLLNKKV